jgi:hypothetical protein
MAGQIPAPVVTAEVVTDFQAAARKLIARMHDDERVFYVLHGTETYSKLLHAYAKSLSRTLPEDASMMRIKDVWTLLHKEGG